MTPARIVAELFADPDDYRDAVGAHLAAGVFHASPLSCIMARPVRRDASRESLADVWSRHENPDAWLIWAAAGDMADMLRIAPYPLPWVGFARRGSAVRWCRWDALARRVGKN